MEQFGSKDLRPVKSGTFRQPKTSSLAIVGLLLTLAAARQATFLEKAQETYCRGLDGFLLVDIQGAVAAMALQERPEGRSSMPSLGEMVTACQRAAQRRHEASAEEKRRQEAQYVRDNPERFCTWKEVIDDMQMMRDACEAAFGSDYRKMYKPEYDDRGRVVREFGLCEVYQLAMKGSAS